LSAPRFHCPDDVTAADAGDEYTLPDAVAHHALRVLRLGVGDSLTVFAGSAGEFAATLVRADKRQAIVRLEGFDPIEREAMLAITLLQGLAANDAMDHALRRAVELGAAAIRPVVTSRSARMPGGDHGARRLAHWRQIAVAACEQCGRNRIPYVHDVVPLERLLAERAHDATGLILVPDASAALAAVPAPAQAIELLIGPEGGFAPAEVAAAQAAGMTAVRLGPRVLRTETAALAALAAINARWGDFGC
jgi:16S rRNA (uracil1498-N3)-methyltransferase